MPPHIGVGGIGDVDLVQNISSEAVEVVLPSQNVSVSRNLLQHSFAFLIGELQAKHVLLVPRVEHVNQLLQVEVRLRVVPALLVHLN